MNANGLLILALLVGADTSETSSVDADDRIDFDTQIVPTITKAGCNVAACHGAAAGRGGLKLSLWGLNPKADHDAIVRELEGHRVNLIRPEESLLLLKATGELDHEGEDALTGAPQGTERLLEWIAGGARRNNSRKLAHLKVSPVSPVSAARGDVIPLRVSAEFDDGTTSDVTPWTVFQSDDPVSVEIMDTQPTSVCLHRGGRHTVLCRFMNRVVPLVFMVPLSDEVVPQTVSPGGNFIDEEILKTLATIRLPVSPAADERSFVRRIHLDLTGTLPTPEQLDAYLEDGRDNRREELVGRLLAAPEFADYWTFKFAKLLRIRSQPKQPEGARKFHDWLHTRITNGTPYDRMVTELLTATGDTHEVGPANFYRVVTGARNQAEYVSELLMGARMRCANCHNHPLDKWTQDDYHGLAAVFARVEQGRIVTVGGRGTVTHPVTGEAARLRVPGVRFLGEVDDPRSALAEWMTDPGNPYFARAMVNRLWKAMMGRGLVEPTDDVRDTNPPSHPALLDALATDFVRHDYRIRHTLRVIATSDAYARSSTTVPGNESDTMFYSHALVRPLEAEVLADALTSVTGVAEQYNGQPADTRAIALFDPRIPSNVLDVLGRCAREQSCESLPDPGTLAQKLHMVNGALINERITSPQGRLSRSLASRTPDRELLNQLYLVAFSREPSVAELEFWNKHLAGAGEEERQALFEDIVWSVLACREFVTNH
ncbi:MAG: DUF1553 domain-containing protein [Fuerstiella sp.]|nr:DUF1553 domain-containing protein [Fuerstiella sp.]MCP4783738.1 DUF1553 domain-containing protein [Fuerstiella sp.]MCP4857027.1 DUF1553 domain-containing protein [Fuerstiella sp.]